MGRPATNPLWSSIRPPNYGSEKATPQSLKIDLHYKELNIWERWTWDRYVRLSRYLNLTPEELASVVCLKHQRLEHFERENHLYSFKLPDRPVALLLTMLEAHVLKHLTTDVVESPMPDLNKL